eukprot:CAMPEP_0185829996 /NCGR_PEP_ID=MMETSP1353-20130828/571_1 /TAXON_ID=1077150 /ORGANISM="Erythrolobus australicus, Strain CCMP3124" /LENGTH=388 /DNA_ID=CAMNT_0028527845 /DNA_START=217 /DNA_END=1384 /DNA_ORIENTATION=-
MCVELEANFARGVFGSWLGPRAAEGEAEKRGQRPRLVLRLGGVVELVDGVDAATELSSVDSDAVSEVSCVVEARSGAAEKMESGKSAADTNDESELQHSSVVGDDMSEVTEESASESSAPSLAEIFTTWSTQVLGSSASSSGESDLRTSQQQQKVSQQRALQKLASSKSQQFKESNWLDTCAAAFSGVGVTESGVDLHSLIVALESITSIFDCVMPGGKASWVRDKAKQDFRMNIGKVRQAMLYFDVHTTTELFEVEKRCGGYTDNSGTVGILWIKRVLQLNLLMLRNVWEDYKSNGGAAKHKLRDHLRDAYRRSVHGCYNWLGKKMFGMGLRFAPDVTVFYKSLGFNHEQPFLDALQSFLAKTGHVINPLIVEMNDLEIETISCESI